MRSKMKKRSRYLSTEEIKRISNAISDIEQSWICKVPHLPPTSWSSRISQEQNNIRQKNFITE